MDEFYSRTAKGKSEKETLSDHLKLTAKLAGIFADSFDEKGNGEWLGLIHDTGKASKLFQCVLNGTEHNVNHECAGALLMYTITRRILKPTQSQLLSAVVYAHHKGLLWYIEDDLNSSVSGKRETESRETSRRFSVTNEKEFNAAKDYVLRTIHEYAPSQMKPLKEVKSHNYPNLPKMLHARMLLSCLCDADYTAAASYDNPDILKKAEEVPLEAKKLLDALIDYKSNVSQKSDSNVKLNSIRNEIFDLCIEAGKRDDVFFTLTAPTGTGKTLSLFAFALSNAIEKEKKRIIIVLPYLSIINQNANIYCDICGERFRNHILESHSMAEYNEETELYAEHWNSPVIITTSVKFFESLFKSKPTDLRFVHSIANSVVVFDEAQSIPTELIGTTMESVNMLINQYKCTVLFSTATQPNFEKRKDLKDIYNAAAEIIPAPEKIYSSLARVDINWKINGGEKTSFEAVADEMSSEKSAACVVNRKDHAQKLYQLLSVRCNKDELYFISTDMCKSHRERVINEISYRQKNNLPCILVSTSCIEAGVDFDFNVMYRSLAPLDSIVQCAGRCNRNGKSSGKMTVFIPDEEKLYPSVYFERASRIVLRLRARHPININDPSHIKEYYDELFTDNSQDKEKLVNAIDDMDFTETEKQYKFINQTGVNVLVPYYDEIELYERLKAAATGNHAITNEWIKDAAPITVNSFKTDWLSRHCIHPNIFTKHGGIVLAENWYILENYECYSDKIGLTIKEDEQEIYAF